MKTLNRLFPIVLIMLFLVPQLATAQASTKSDKKNPKAQVNLKEEILKLVDAREFVIKAYRLQDRSLNNYNVNSSINFVKIDSTEAVVQFGFNGYFGSNGLGGLTAEGKLSGYKVTGRDDSDPVRVKLYASTMQAGHLTFLVTIFNDGRARATVTDMYGSRLTFTGEIASIDGARIYQGMSLY